MLFNLIGFDVQPHSGTGVNLILGPSGGLIVDQDHNGQDDTTQSPPPYVYDARYDPRNVNDSPAAAAGGQLLFPRNILAMPAPDVDYTYPDHNNMFLGYKGYTWDYRFLALGLPPAPRLVIKPSFHRPELLRDGTGQPVGNWATASGAGGRWRFIIDAASNPAGNLTLNTYVTQDAGLIGASPTSQVRAGFPFLVDQDADGNYSEQGVFGLVAEDRNLNGSLDPGEDLNANGVLDLVPFPTLIDGHDFDVDNDGDGVNDGIWMDFDLAVLVRASDSRTYVPLISASIYDLDSLLDANMVGNTFGETRTAATTNFGNGGSISVSAQGLSSPAELNPQYALDAVYSEASAEAKPIECGTCCRPLAREPRSRCSKATAICFRSPACGTWTTTATRARGRALGPAERCSRTRLSFATRWRWEAVANSGREPTPSKCGCTRSRRIPCRSWRTTTSSAGSTR
ncbi:MAG: Uncharacterized protein FD138_4083 [Planctomycetota bacterium]|nr:MAG: Uncharacterized protein FD138_4083 [Planctomycetota bacterium]